MGRKGGAKSMSESKKRMRELNHVGIRCGNIRESVRFYRDVLGFEIKEDENAVNVFLEKDGTLFLLFRRTDFEHMTGQTFGYAKGINGHYEISLGVENYAAVDAAWQEVTGKGAVSVMAPVTEPWGQRTCYIADPEGNLIEIGSFNAE